MDENTSIGTRQFKQSAFIGIDHEVDVPTDIGECSRQKWPPGFRGARIYAVWTLEYPGGVDKPGGVPVADKLFSCP